MKSEKLDEALEMFDKFNSSSKATISIVSPSFDDNYKTWKYHVFVFFPKQDGSYSDAECFSNDLSSAITSCISMAETELLEDLFEDDV